MNPWKRLIFENHRVRRPLGSPAPPRSRERSDRQEPFAPAAAFHRSTHSWPASFHYWKGASPDLGGGLYSTVLRRNRWSWRPVLPPSQPVRQSQRRFAAPGHAWRRRKTTAAAWPEPQALRGPPVLSCVDVYAFLTLCPLRRRFDSSRNTL